MTAMSELDRDGVAYANRPTPLNYCPIYFRVFDKILDQTESSEAAAIFCRMLYHFQNSIIRRNNKKWFARKKEDLAAWAKISVRKLDKILKLLEQKELITKKTFKFKGTPQLFFHVPHKLMVELFGNSSGLSLVNHTPIYFHTFDKMIAKTDSLINAIILARLSFNFQNSIIYREEIKWFTRTKEDLATWAKIGIRKLDTSLKALAKNNLIIKKVFKFKGTPQTFFSIPADAIEALFGFDFDFCSSSQSSLTTAVQVKVKDTPKTKYQPNSLVQPPQNIPKQLGKKGVNDNAIFAESINKEIEIKKVIENNHTEKPIAETTQSKDNNKKSNTGKKSKKSKVISLIKNFTLNEQDQTEQKVKKVKKLNPRQEAYLQGTVNNLIQQHGCKITCLDEFMAQARFSLTNPEQFKQVNSFTSKVNILAKLVRVGRWLTPIGWRRYSQEGRAATIDLRRSEVTYQQSKAAEISAANGVVTELFSQVSHESNENNENKNSGNSENHKNHETRCFDAKQPQVMVMQQYRQQQEKQKQRKQLKLQQKQKQMRDQQGRAEDLMTVLGRYQTRLIGCTNELEKTLLTNCIAKYQTELFELQRKAA